jgi:hypothetical protein
MLTFIKWASLVVVKQIKMIFGTECPIKKDRETYSFLF